MNVPDASVLLGFTTVCGAFGFVGKVMITTLKQTITKNEKAADRREAAANRREEAAQERMTVQEGKTEACEQDRSAMREEQSELKVKIEVVERTLKIIKQCPEATCPNHQLLRITSPIGYVRGS